MLSVDEAISHPHNAARDTFIEVAGVRQPAPAPRFSRTPADTPRPAAGAGADTEQVLGDLGMSVEEIAALRDRHVVG